MMGKWRIGRLGDFIVPGYGSCYKCRTNWFFVEGHTTLFGPSGGGFPLCEQCWQELTPEQRLPFYRQLFENWQPHSNYSWAEIEAAVLRGL
jgi:hypothetical protein